MSHTLIVLSSELPDNNTHVNVCMHVATVYASANMCPSYMLLCTLTSIVVVFTISCILKLTLATYKELLSITAL